MKAPVLTSFNREGFSLTFQKLLEWECQRAVRYQESFALAVVEVDSAPAGSEPEESQVALEIIAENVNKEVRKTDLRFCNGNLLNILLLHVGGLETFQIVERVRSRIEHYSFPGKKADERVNRTVSIGAACFPLHSVNSSDLTERAMGCLRQAQGYGGNKVMVFNNRT